MKQISLVFTFVLLNTLGQAQLIHGTVYEYGSKQPISLTNSQFFLLGNSQLISVKIDSSGSFSLNLESIRHLGSIISLSIGTLGTDYNYANFEMVNIPIDSLQIAIEKIFVKPAYMIASCGRDCLIVNNKRTYKLKEYFVDNGVIRYRVRRNPYEGKMKNHVAFEAKYQTNFSTDIIK